MSDATPFGFGKFVPGFDFLQNLSKGASGGGIPQMPQLANWVAPTISVEELEKRIEELKAVQFWLEQNSRALTATVQALEVQKMTLATLKGMNVHMADVANAFKTQTASVMAGVAKSDAGAARSTGASSSAAPASPYSAPPPAPAPAPVSAAADSDSTARTGNDETTGESKASSGTAPGIVDPMQWWGALTQQFQQIAATALKDAGQPAALEGTGKLATRMAQDALQRANDMAAQLAAQGAKAMQSGARSATSRKPAAGSAPPRKAVAKKAGARSKAVATKTPRKTSATPAKRKPKA